MAEIVWTNIDRTYETGIDRGVLYLTDGTAVPWNGLVEVSYESEYEATAAYFDGFKVHDMIKPKEFQGTVKALSYPKELANNNAGASGVYGIGQPKEIFGFSYREKIVEGGYKVHIFGNLTINPTSRDYETLSDSSEAIELEWDLIGPRTDPENGPPTTRVTIDTRFVDSDLWTELQAILYGNDIQDAGFNQFAPEPTYVSFLTWLIDWVKVRITDWSEDYWLLQTDLDGYVTDMGGSIWRIENVDATYLDANQTYYEIGDT